MTALPTEPQPPERPAATSAPRERATATNAPRERAGHLLLHVCCAPCLLRPLISLESQWEHITLLYDNPNIAPREEYERRRDFARQVAATRGHAWIETPYEPQRWRDAVAAAATCGEKRCLGCYRTRLTTAVTYAAKSGADAFTTTLLISPYQDHPAIHRLGTLAALQEDITYLPADFSQYFYESQQLAREQGIYRQKYCGCLPSLEEARAQDEKREAAKQARKDERAREAALNKERKRLKKERDRAHE